MSYDVTEFHPVYEFNGIKADEILQSAKTIWNDYHSENTLKGEFLEHHLSLICINCLRLVQNEPVLDNKNQDLYQAFRRLLRNNFREHKKVKDYAAVLNISEKKLNEVVSTKTGFSCSTIIYKQLILEAKRLLNTNISSKEVAYE